MGFLEQKRLYEHYTALADNKLKDKNNVDFKPIIRENARKHADEILKNYPAVFVKPEAKEKKDASRK